jgi:hypothetical protein
MSSPVGISVLALYTLFICLPVLGWYYSRRDDQDLAIKGLEPFSRIVWGDCCAGDLERKAVRRRLPVHLAVVGCSKRSSKLLEDKTLASRVLGILLDRAGFV